MSQRFITEPHLLTVIRIAFLHIKHLYFFFFFHGQTLYNCNSFLQLLYKCSNNVGENVSPSKWVGPDQ